MLRKQPLCPHCVALTNALTGCGAMLEADSDHYAMALARAARAEGRSLDDVIAYLRGVADAPELEPRARKPFPRVDPAHPFVPVVHRC